MSGVGAKLSRHVLGMKFMRKTKESVDKGKIEKIHRDSHFAPDSPAASAVKAEASHGVKNEAQSQATPTLVVEELWSYNQCERYIFGRQSYGGFNPIVEKNVRKGIWKPFYLEDDGTTVDSSDDEDTKERQSDVDVSDEEMASTFGSLVGTLGKRFRKKFKKEDEEEKKMKKGKKDNQRGDNRNNNGKKPNWFKGKGRNNDRNKNANDSRGQGQSQRQGHSGRNRNQDTGGGGQESGRKFWNRNKKRQRESTGSTHYQNDTPSSTQDRNQKNRKRPKQGQGSFSREDGQGQSTPPPFKRGRFLKPSDD